MIRLKEIKIDNGYIYCKAFLPNYDEIVNLKFNIETRQFDKIQFKKGFEYFKRHIAKAKLYFDKCLDEGIEIPEEKDVMWM